MAKKSSDNNLYAWGATNATFLDGVNNNLPATPIFSWSQVTANSNGAFAAIKSDGTLWVMGNNDYGMLGTGTANNKISSITQVGADNTWSKVVMSLQHTAAIKTDGTLWTWGNNGSGQLGDNTIVHKSSPIQVGALTTWRSVAVGGMGFTVATRTDNNLYTWGISGYGQLGDGQPFNRSSPVLITGTWSDKIAAGYHFTLAIKTDGTLWTWGNNGMGQLGLNQGNTAHKSTPTQVGAATDWSFVSATIESSAAMRGSNLYCWGSNYYGTVGTGAGGQYGAHRSSNRNSGVEHNFWKY
jgi:alpha-tubulin suppressor-like RCC1 family protein